MTMSLKSILRKIVEVALIMGNSIEQVKIVKKLEKAMI